MSNRTWDQTLSIVGLALLASATVAGCATAGTRPEDMSAADHLKHADMERAEADHAAARYDPSAARPMRVPGDPTHFTYDVDTYNPTLTYKEAAKRHQRAAEEHAAAAAALESFENAQCREIPPQVRVECPLLGQVRATHDVANGVEVTLAEGVPKEAFMAHAQCHLAFARTAGYGGMDACPLFLHGVQATEGEGRVVRFTVDDADKVQELRQLMKTHVEP